MSSSSSSSQLSDANCSRLEEVAKKSPGLVSVLCMFLIVHNLVLYQDLGRLKKYVQKLQEETKELKLQVEYCLQKELVAMKDEINEKTKDAIDNAVERLTAVIERVASQNED
ncbi:hypothetical protein DCAR_0101219 [Daucus carota subsp. sativus]|uniref:Uncharacterized protein n=1 Tax=Daucus carota subsp. sativus TaxID=79200 RepID=A0A166G7W2_DAUCS|nr:hypothetical protein DCAR_0101219 [Daucus carota subsp. sativus]